MFYLFSRSKVKRFLTGGFVLLAIIAIMTGCSTDLEDDTNYPGELPDGLIGEWVFSGDYGEDTYIITETTLEYPADFGFGYDGTIEFVSNYNSISGVIIIKYSPAGHPDYDIWGTTEPFYNGNDYTAVYYRELKADTVQMAGAVNLVDYSSPATFTLEEAIAKFTRANSVKYIDWGYVMPYTKTST